jgi:hypothetical protein
VSGGGRGAIMVKNGGTATANILSAVWIDSTTYGADEYGSTPTSNSGMYSPTAITTTTTPFVGGDWFDPTIWDAPGSALPKLEFEP